MSSDLSPRNCFHIGSFDTAGLEFKLQFAVAEAHNLKIEL